MSLFNTWPVISFSESTSLHRIFRAPEDGILLDNETILFGFGNEKRIFASIEKAKIEKVLIK